MTPNEIAQTLLNEMPPETRNMWRYEIGSATPHLDITFRAKRSAALQDIELNLQKVAALFLASTYRTSRHPEVYGDNRTPRVVMQGGV